MCPNENNLIPQNCFSTLTKPVSFNFGITSNSIVETDSPIFNDFIKFKSSKKPLNYFSTPVFELDLKKLASQRISLDTLNNIAKLEDDWNGYSAKSIPDEVVILCRKIIRSLDYQPEIYPTGRRTIQMEYEKADRSYLEFEISQDKIKVMEVPKRQYKNAKQYEIPAGNYKFLSEIVSNFCGGLDEWKISTMTESYTA